MAVSTVGSSVVVRQFVEIVRGEVGVHPAANPFVTVEVTEVDRYCLKCFTDGTWDVWHGKHEGIAFQIGRCRCCGAEVTL